MLISSRYCPTLRRMNQAASIIASARPESLRYRLAARWLFASTSEVVEREARKGMKVAK